MADVKPLNKKYSRTDKENYRPVSRIIKPYQNLNISKIYERVCSANYFDADSSKLQFGFREGFSVVNCLLPLTEK